MLSVTEPASIASKPLSNTPKPKQEEERSQSPVPMEVDEGTTEVDLISKIRQQEVIPELFSILHALRTQKLLVKDFDNKLGSIRLKLNNIKQYLRQIDGITESIEERQQKIKLLIDANEINAKFLQEFKSKLNDPN